MSINIVKNNNFGTHNTTYGRQTPMYIVMHYTASNGGTAANHISYFNNRSTTNASADYFVDEVGVYQYNMQIDSRYSWAVGVDYSNGKAPYHGKCTNRNSVSIEMCCYQDKNGKWYIKDDTYKNAVALTKYLMNRYNIPADRVIRHYDVCAKLCPNAVGWLAGTGSEKIWTKFKSEISGGSAADTQSDTKTSQLVRVKVTGLRIRTGAGLSCKSTGYIKPGVYTITETKPADGYTWGKLKSGAGWIALEYTERV